MVDVAKIPIISLEYILFLDRINSIAPIIKAIISEAVRKPGNSGTTTDSC